MLRKLAFLFGLLFCFTAHAAEMVNVEYIHMAVKKKWDIDIPYNPSVTNPKVAANMKYLLTVIDRANRELNGHETTDYGNGEYATMYAADTVATNDAVARLIKKELKYPFVITTDAATTTFRFKMSAAGTFTVDWGDGEIQEIVRDSTTEKTMYSHTYAEAGQYEIGFSGHATEYSTSYAAITFVDEWWYYGDQVARLNALFTIDGSLGAIFGTIGDGSGAGQQPNFNHSFYNSIKGELPKNLFAGITGPAVSNMFGSTFSLCTELTSIPAGLFSGITTAADSMFINTFRYCYSLTEIPEGLFPSIDGPAASRMFYGTFQECSSLTTLPNNLFGQITQPAESMFQDTFRSCRSLKEIPAGLFASITGAPARFMFLGTFEGCSGLTSIPAGLFSSITGSVAWGMFLSTFQYCSSLQSIPENLFGDLSGAAQTSMFANTFYGCTNLSGPSARINGKYLYEIWPDAASNQVGSCYGNDTGLSDYESIPSAWK